MASPSDLVNLAEGIHKLNVNMGMIIKKVKLVELSTKTECFFEYTNLKDDLIAKVYVVYKNYQKNVDETLKKRFANTYK